MIIAPFTDEDQLSRRIKAINQHAEDVHSIHFAVGTYVVSEGDDIRKAMRLADERMYIDKNEYYKAHPEKKYR